MLAVNCFWFVCLFVYLPVAGDMLRAVVASGSSLGKKGQTSNGFKTGNTFALPLYKYSFCNNNCVSIWMVLLVILFKDKGNQWGLILL